MTTIGITSAMLQMPRLGFIAGNRFPTSRTTFGFNNISHHNTFTVAFPVAPLPLFVSPPLFHAGSLFVTTPIIPLSFGHSLF